MRINTGLIPGLMALVSLSAWPFAAIGDDPVAEPAGVGAGLIVR